MNHQEREYHTIFKLKQVVFSAKISTIMIWFSMAQWIHGLLVDWTASSNVRKIFGIFEM